MASQLPLWFPLLAGSILLGVAGSPHAQQSGGPVDDEGIRLRNQLMQIEAANSCEQRDRSAFFDAIIQSNEVLASYSRGDVLYVVHDGAGKILRKQIVESINYADLPPLFPISMIDYSRVASSEAAGSDRPVDVVLHFEDMADGGFSVGWTMVQYVGEEMDVPYHLDGTAFDPADQADGRLLFAATPECWELVADHRWQTLPSSGLYLETVEPSQEQIDGVLSPIYKSCMAETGGYTDLMQECQTAELQALDDRLDEMISRHSNSADLALELADWKAALPSLCLRESEPFLAGGSADGLVLASCHLGHVAKRLLWMTKLPDR